MSERAFDDGAQRPPRPRVLLTLTVCLLAAIVADALARALIGADNLGAGIGVGVGIVFAGRRGWLPRKGA